MMNRPGGLQAHWVSAFVRFCQVAALGVGAARPPGAAHRREGTEDGAREAAVGQQSRLIPIAVVYETTLGFAVVYEEKHPETGTLSYTQEARVTLDRAFGTIGTDNKSHEVVQSNSGDASRPRRARFKGGVRIEREDSQLRKKERTAPRTREKVAA